VSVSEFYIPDVRGSLLGSGGYTFTGAARAISSSRKLYRLAVEADELSSGRDGGWIGDVASGPKGIGFEINAYAPHVPAISPDAGLAKIPEGV
jgi:hypothetical protein